MRADIYYCFCSVSLLSCFLFLSRVWFLFLRECVFFENSCAVLIYFLARILDCICDKKWLEHFTILSTPLLTFGLIWFNMLFTMKSTVPSLMLLTSFSTVSTALQATPNSPCASLCLDSSASSGGLNISEDDILCSNREYASEKGQKFEGCMNCLQNSTYSQGSQSDQTWFMCKLPLLY